MKNMLVAASALVAVAISGPAFSQNAPNSSQSSANSSQNLAAAQQIQQDLKSAGFSDVKVVAESFVVQAKTKDGHPVVMTIGPHGMSVFEAMNSTNTKTTGSNSSGPQTTTGSNTSGQSRSK